MTTTRPRRKATPPAPPLEEDTAPSLVLALAACTLSLVLVTAVGLAAAVLAARLLFDGFLAPFLVGAAADAAGTAAAAAILWRRARAGGWRR